MKQPIKLYDSKVVIATEEQIPTNEELCIRHLRELADKMEGGKMYFHEMEMSQDNDIDPIFDRWMVSLSLFKPKSDQSVGAV